MAIIAAMNNYIGPVTQLLKMSSGLGLADRLLQALLLPYPTYAVLIALVTHWAAARLQEHPETVAEVDCLDAASRLCIDLLVLDGQEDRWASGDRSAG